MDYRAILIIILANLLAGFIGAQVGGGGLISIPTLLFLGIPAPNAIAISKFADIFLNFSGAFHYLKKGKFSLKIALLFGIICTIGGGIGAGITLNIDKSLLNQIISILLIFLLFITLLKKEIGLSDQTYHVQKKHLVYLLPIAFLLGIYGGAIGIATCTLLAFYFVFQGQSFSQGMGLALFISFLVAISSSLVFFYYGSIWFLYAIPQAIASAIGAYFGSKCAIKKGNLWVKGFLVVIVTISIIKLLLESF
ncbi:MAG: sulfite exporter TauE/SafE family protein [Candidatus Gracilibacteria bacterium]